MTTDFYKSFLWHLFEMRQVIVDLSKIIQVIKSGLLQECLIKNSDIFLRKYVKNNREIAVM